MTTKPAGDTFGGCQPGTMNESSSIALPSRSTNLSLVQATCGYIGQLGRGERGLNPSSAGTVVGAVGHPKTSLENRRNSAFVLFRRHGGKPQFVLAEYQLDAPSLVCRPAHTHRQIRLIRAIALL